jgi:hypothetical protein
MVRCTYKSGRQQRKYKGLSFVSAARVIGQLIRESSPKENLGGASLVWVS